MENKVKGAGDDYPVITIDTSKLISPRITEENADRFFGVPKEQPIEEEEESLHEAVYQIRKKEGWYDPWYKKITFRFTKTSTPRHLLPALTWSPYIKALGISFWKWVWQISFNRFNNTLDNEV